MNNPTAITFYDKCWRPQKAGLRFIYDFFWPRTEDACSYEFGTISGLYIRGKLDILMILNEEQHNGHFELFMRALEREAAKQNKPARICSFMNERLYQHIKKRPGWVSPFHTMDMLEYWPKQGGDSGNNKGRTDE